jgi:phosphoenolpyruvate carboxylase
MVRTLSDDVRLVIDTLGHVIAAHGGDALFADVEAMRLGAKAARDTPDEAERHDARTRLAETAGRLEPGVALEVARAFTLYFQLVNLAEDAQRTRELRRREAEGGPGSVRDSIHGAIDAVARSGATREQALTALREIKLGYVFTAHPTEARRRTTERLLADVARTLRRRERRALTGLEVAAADRGLRATIEALFEHAAERSERPAVLEEVEAGLWYLRHVMLDAVPRFHRRLRHAFEARFGAIDPLDLPMTVQFGSWMGGDRDGNPFVTAAVTERTLGLHRAIVLERYEQDLEALIDPLAAVDRRLPDHEALDDALERAAAAVPELVGAAERRNPREPLRRLLTFAIGRIQRTRSQSAGGYGRPEDFIEDLVVMRDTLRGAQAMALPDDALLDLILRVRCFGFHLATLDVREDSRVHRRVVAELAGVGDDADRDPATRILELDRIALPRPDDGRPSRPARRLLELFDGLRRLQGRFGPEAIGTYVISMTESEADVLEVLRLAELHGIDRSLDIVPLLETPKDLERAEPLLDALFSHPAYARHLDQRGRVQELLVGYSDSMKQGGMLASRVRVGEAQRAAAAACRRHDVRLRVFHGRGGSVSRGGGPTHRAIYALPRDAFGGQARITEQGEMRAHNFANPDLAVRYLEQTVGAALGVRLEVARGQTDRPEAEAGMLTDVAATSVRAYRALVGDPRLVPYFQTATPFEQIATLTLGSRPTRRGGRAAGLAGLRAIPWVFAWSQSRHVLTGWYGVGSALTDALASDGGETALRALYRDSRFFHDLIENVEMALAKTDLSIASRYAALCDDDETRSLFGTISEEFNRTVSAILRVANRGELLGGDAVLARSITLRNPYVDPLSYLQIEALRRLRKPIEPGDEAGQSARAAWSRVARVTVQGIAAGIRHTG